MRARGRQLLAAIGSGVLHAGPVIWGALRFAPELDLDLEIEFTEVELIEPDKVQGSVPPPPEPPAPTPAPPEPAKPEPAKPEPKQPEPKKPEPKQPDASEPGSDHDLGKRHSKVDELGPTNSTFYAMLVPKKIRKLSFREAAVDIMSPLPDFDYLITGGGFDALRDFDYIVIASPEIRDWRQTFLAVEYKMSREELMRGIERAARRNGDVIEWIEKDGVTRGNPRPADENEPDVDARWFVVLPDVAVYVREEFLDQVLADEVGTAKTSGNFVANLTHLRKFAAGQPTAGLQLVVKDIRAALKRAKGLPFEVPDSIELSAEATEDPELFVRIEFVSVVDAKAAENWWKNELPEKLTGVQGFMIKSMVIDMLEMSRVDRELHFWGRFETKQAAKLLELIAGESARMLKKSPEEIEAQRRERKENWLKRNKGKLGPGSLDADAGTSAPATQPSRDGASPPSGPPVASDTPEPPVAPTP